MTPPCPPAGAMIRRRKSVCTLQHDSLYDVQSSRLICGHCFKGLSFRGLISTLKMLLYSSQSPFFNEKYPNLIILGVQSVSALEMNQCPHNSLLVPCILWIETHAAIGLGSFILHQLFGFTSFKREVLPHCLLFVYNLAFSKHSPLPAMMILLFHDCLPLPILHRRQASCRRSFVITQPDTDWPCNTPYHPRH